MADRDFRFLGLAKPVNAHALIKLIGRLRQDLIDDREFIEVSFRSFVRTLIQVVSSDLERFR